MCGLIRSVETERVLLPHGILTETNCASLNDVFYGMGFVEGMKFRVETNWLYVWKVVGFEAILSSHLHAAHSLSVHVLRSLSSEILNSALTD